ncbi:MAG: hypothetical protein GY849_21895, partial [Deltaproteobacteria bacterium]|nr:hypothetical protein [Deltaproteobacteria bacterium]
HSRTYVRRSNENGDYAAFLDMNGDGLPDRVEHHNYNTGQYSIWVALNNGNGFDDLTLWKASDFGGHPHTYVRASNTDGDYAAFLDMNGDGLPDRVEHYNYNTHQYGIWVALNNGSGFDDLALWKASNFGGQRHTYVRRSNEYGDYAAFLDMNGDGLPDRVEHHNYNVHQYGIWVSVNLNGFDLTTSVSNGIGATTHFEFQPSTAWDNKYMPRGFILQTVSSMTVDDGLGNAFTTNYAYSGGLFDYGSREFRGFEYVEQTNPDGTTVKTWFHQDAYMKGRERQVEVRAPDEGPLLTRTTLTWDKVFLYPPNTYAFVKLDQKRTESYDGVTLFTQEDYTYDHTNGNLLTKVTSGTDGESITQTHQYQNFGSWLWRLTQETIEGSASGKVRETYYGYETGTGNMLYKEYWLQGGTNPRIDMTYDPYGNLKTLEDARDNTTITDYDTDTHTYPVKITRPETNGVSHIVEFAYDYRFGKKTMEKDENGNETHYAYDAFGRVIQVDYPDGGQALTEYFDDASPRYKVEKVKEDASGSFIDKYTYIDGLGRGIQTITFGEWGKSIVTKTHYDEMGRPYLKQGPFFDTGTGWPKTPPAQSPWVLTTYDYRGRPVEVESPHGEYETIHTTFSYNRLSTTVIDPDQSQKTELKDYLGRIVQVAEHADGGSLQLTTYAYNAAGDLLTVTDHHGNVTTMTYDTLGRKTAMDDPDMGQWQYTHDKNGNLLTQTDARGQVITLTYDALNRKTSKSFSTTDPDVVYTYDNLSIPNGRGRLYSVANGVVTTTYNRYDKMGRIKGVTKTISGDGTPHETLYDYDLSGKPTRTTYPDAYAVYYTYYPGTGLLHTVTGSDAEVFAVYSLYEPTGKIGQVFHGNGTATRYTYDPESTRLVSMVTSDPSGEPEKDIQRRTYRYTPAGDMLEITDDLEDITYTYTYDKLHRLLGETNTGTYDPITYQYNAIGNITSRTMGANTFTYTYDTDHKHAVKTITLNGAAYDYTYDLNGNMTGGPDLTDPGEPGERTINYNAENMPTRIVYQKGGSRIFLFISYDGGKKRAKKGYRGGSTTYYIGKHFEVKDGAAVKYVFAGNTRIARVTTSERYYYHKDHLGSSVAMTSGELDANEALLGDFGVSHGLLEYDGAIWTQLSSLDADNSGNTMVAYGGGMAADFGANGLWHYNGTGWTQINTNDPQRLLAYDNTLVGDFGGIGLWKYDGGTWTQLTPFNADNSGNTMVAYGGGMAVDFGVDGLWHYNGSTWTQLHSYNPQWLMAYDNVLVGDFGTIGLWQYDGAAWTQIAGDLDNTGNTMIAYGGGMAADFGADGLWLYDGVGWIQHSADDPQWLMAYGNVLVVDFGATGLWQFDGATWTGLAGDADNSGNTMIPYGDGMAVDFGANGLWHYDGADWTQLDSRNVAYILSVHMYRNTTVVEATQYMPFGGQRDHTGSVTSNYKFTDQELDPETGLYNYNARLYDPIIGRFISPDTIVQAPYDPQTLNRYSYCRNNPLIYVDPSGHGFFKWIKRQWKKIRKVGKWLDRQSERFNEWCGRNNVSVNAHATFATYNTDIGSGVPEYGRSSGTWTWGDLNYGSFINESYQTGYYSEVSYNYSDMQIYRAYHGLKYDPLKGVSFNFFGEENKFSQPLLLA